VRSSSRVKGQFKDRLFPVVSSSEKAVRVGVLEPGIAVWPDQEEELVQLVQLVPDGFQGSISDKQKLSKKLIQVNY
jgi:hypothetical protein